MQVGEERLVLPGPEQRELLGDRLLHLAHQVGRRPHVLGGVDDLGAGPDEVGVGHGRAVAGALLARDGVAGRGELAHTGRRQRDPPLVGLDLTGDSDDHRYSSMLLITCLMRV